MQKCNKPLSQKASALLSSLFIMTLVAIAATAMSLRIQLDIYRTQLIVDTNKLYLASQGVIFWAMDTLSNPANKLDIVGKNGQVAEFPTQLQKLYPEMTMEGRMYDLQARFNLNALDKNPGPAMFQNLLARILPGKSAKDRMALTYAINDWISPYDPGKGKDIFLSYYLRQQPPYQTSHQAMQSVSELRLIMGVNNQEYMALMPVVTALPEKVPINLKTAPANVLQSLSNKLTESMLNDLINARNEPNFEIKARQILTPLQVPSAWIGFQSNYFLAVAVVTHRELKLINYTILKRTSGQKNAAGEPKNIVTLVSENLNAL